MGKERSVDKTNVNMGAPTARTDDLNRQYVKNTIDINKTTCVNDSAALAIV